MVTENRKSSHQSSAPPCGTRVLCSTSGTPTLGIFTKEKNSKTVWLRKQTGLMSRGTKGLEGTKILTFKSPCVVSFTLRPTTKAKVWKAPRPYVKESYLLILKQLMEGQETIETLSGDWQMPFLLSSPVLLAQTSELGCSNFSLSC